MRPRHFLIAALLSLPLMPAMLIGPPAGAQTKKAEISAKAVRVGDHDGLHVDGAGVRTVTLVDALPFTVTAPKGAALYLWSTPPGVTAAESDTGDALTVTAAAKGTYAFGLKTITIDWDGRKTVAKTYTVVVTVGDVPPGPTPVPPGPAPIPGDGLRVLFVYESADSLDPAQAIALRSGTVRDYLNSHCAADGMVKAWRVWDKDVDTSAESASWQAAMKRPRQSLPWVIISGGKNGNYEGPMPKNTDETVALLKKYGGD